MLFVPAQSLPPPVWPSCRAVPQTLITSAQQDRYKRIKIRLSTPILRHATTTVQPLVRQHNHYTTVVTWDLFRILFVQIYYKTLIWKLKGVLLTLLNVIFRLRNYYLKHSTSKWVTGNWVKGQILKSLYIFLIEKHKIGIVQ